MAAFFVPSLKHTVLAKVAVQICNDSGVKYFVNELNFLWDKSSGKDKWGKLLDKTDDKVSELHLPPQLHQCVLAVIKPIALEIARWKSDHLKVLGNEFDFCFSQLHWKPEGIIDRPKTAQMLILNENVNIRNRFYFACYYCYECEVERIWNIICSTGKRVIFGENISFCLIFWISWLHKKGTITWSHLAQQILNQLYPNTFCNFQKNPLWLRCFFDKLTQEEKNQCIAFTVKNTFKDHDNFRFCVSKLDENQRESVFKDNPVRLLRFLLDWPYQSLFLEASEQMLKYLKDTDFRYLIHFIIYNRIVAEWYDFDYFNLLKAFWRRSPKDLKEYIRKDTVFEPLKMVIYHDFLLPFPKEKIIQCANNVEPPQDKYWLLREGDFFYTC